MNTGGFSENELREIKERALALGYVEHYSIDISREYYEKCIKYMIYGNVLKNNTYPLSVSSERVFMAIAIAQFAKEHNVNCIAHGSTGAGNDQVRFDYVFNIINPEMEIITPIRDQKLTRDEEIEYLKKKGIHYDWSKNEYSINKGLWGTSIGGKETLCSNKMLPESAYPSKHTEHEPIDMVLSFSKGEIVGVNNTMYESSLSVIQTVEFGKMFHN